MVSLVGQCEIKHFAKLLMTKVVTKDNCKQIHKIMKQFIFEREFEDMKRKYLSQKGPNRLDFSSIRPGKMSRHLEDPRTIEECRGVTVIVQMISNSYWTPYRADKTSLCPVCNLDFDSDKHLWVCKESRVAMNMKRDLIAEFPPGHPMKDLDLNNEMIMQFCLDPESSNLGKYQIVSRPPNYQRILSLTRLIAYFSHRSRAAAILPTRLVQKMGFHQKRSRGGNS